MNALAYVFVAIAGALNAVQSGSNAALARSLGRPWLVGVLVSSITAAALIVGVLATGARMPEPGRFGAVPWWAWTGGLCGAAYVVSTLFFAGSMGAGLFTGLTITAGTITSIAVDHFGLVGFQQHSQPAADRRRVVDDHRADPGGPVLTGSPRQHRPLLTESASRWTVGRIGRSR